MVGEDDEVADLVDALADIRDRDPARFARLRSLILADAEGVDLSRPPDCEKVSQSD